MSSDLTSSLLQMFGGNIMDQLGSQLGADPATTQKAVGAALPLLLGALGKNASTEDGASALFNALSSKHDGSVLNDLSGFITKGGDVKDGQGILRHTLGSKQTGIEQALSQATGLGTDSTGNLLAMLAPVVMGALGQQDQVPSQLGGLSGLLDMNNDGSIIDDVVNLGSKLLGGLFGSKN